MAPRAATAASRHSGSEWSAAHPGQGRHRARAVIPELAQGEAPGLHHPGVPIRQGAQELLDDRPPQPDRQLGRSGSHLRRRIAGPELHVGPRRAPRRASAPRAVALTVGAGSVSARRADSSSPRCPASAAARRRPRRAVISVAVISVAVVSIGPGMVDPGCDPPHDEPEGAGQRPPEDGGNHGQDDDRPHPLPPSGPVDQQGSQHRAHHRRGVAATTRRAGRALRPRPVGRRGRVLDGVGVDRFRPGRAPLPELPRHPPGPQAAGLEPGSGRTAWAAPAPPTGRPRRTPRGRRRRAGRARGPVARIGRRSGPIRRGRRRRVGRTWSTPPGGWRVALPRLARAPAPRARRSVGAAHGPCPPQRGLAMAGLSPGWTEAQGNSRYVTTTTTILQDRKP